MGLKNALQDLLKNLSREGGYFLTYVEKLVHRKKDSKLKLKPMNRSIAMFFHCLSKKDTVHAINKGA